MKNGKSLFLTVLTVVFASVSVLAQQAGNIQILDDSKKQLLVPLKYIETHYTDNQSSLPQIEHSDSYYSSIADQIVFKELSKTFKSIELLIDSSDITRIYSSCTFINDSSKLVPSADFPKVLQEITDKYKADFIVIPQFCKLTYKAIQQKGWRDSRGGSSYERPVNVQASSDYAIAFYQKNGILNRSAKGSAHNGKPLFYDYAKKKNFDKNVVENSRKKYAPPLLRALSKSIEDAFKKL